MNRLTTCRSLTESEVNLILAGARSEEHVGNQLSDAVVCFVFVEPSTRTKYSFHLAAKLLGATVIDFSLSDSRVASGAMLRDELVCMKNLGVDLFVVRGCSALEVVTEMNLPVVNAGASGEHPTQALVDMLTILNAEAVETVSDLANTTIAFLVPEGCIFRPVTSMLQLLSYTAAKTVVIGNFELPAGPESSKNLNVPLGREDLLGDALQDCDYVYVLPAYSEGRICASQSYRLTKKSVGACKVLHPFPRTTVGVPNTFDGSANDLYSEQQRLSVPVRAAVLKWCFNQL